MSMNSSMRFFRHIWRFNGIVIAAAGFMALGYGALARFVIGGNVFKTIAMAGPAGLGLTTIPRNVIALIGQTVADDGSVVMMIRGKDDVTHALKIDLPGFAVNRDEVFASAAQALG